MQVFVTPSGSHFHARGDCRRIRCGQSAKRSSGVREVELDSLVNMTPCRTCFSDAPRLATFHRYCHQCHSGRPCAHNGGVLVKIPRTWHVGSSLLLSAGERTTAIKYVWPEVAYRYPLASS